MRSPVEAFRDFYRCLVAGRAEGRPGHDFDENGVCRRCGAERGALTGVSLLDLLAAEHIRRKGGTN